MRKKNHAIFVIFLTLPFLVCAQENKKPQTVRKEISVAFPEFTPLPISQIIGFSLQLDLLFGRPERGFPGTVYFNPGKKALETKELNTKLLTINALRFYLDTSIWNISSKDLPIRLVDKNIQQFFLPFYFKKCEVTNREYREFTTWVRDSIARSLLAQIYPDKYYKANSKNLNWKTRINWDGNDKNTSEALKMLYYAENERFFAQKKLDNRKFIYSYTDKNKTVHNVSIYPDTLVWFKDFPYSFNEHQNLYFHHQAYKDYPVTGVNFEQAKAFCHWKTQQIQKNAPSGFMFEVDLPFDYEREFVKTQYNAEFPADCITDLIAIKKQQFFPWQIHKILNTNYTVGNDGEIPLFKTHLADLSNITNKKRITISADLNENGISGIDDNVSEWMNESYQENWLAIITKRWQLLGSVQGSKLTTLKGDTSAIYNNLDSIYLNQLQFQYTKEAPLMMKLEKLFDDYCDPDGRLVRGGNWMDKRDFFSNLCNNGQRGVFYKDAMTFVSPTKSSSMIGFRYVIRVNKL